MYQYSFRAMGSTINVVLDSHQPEHQQLGPQVATWFETWEQHLSRFRPQSELSQLNRRPRRWTRVSPIIWQVLQHALKAARQTDGLVTPTLLYPLHHLGYRHSFTPGQTITTARPALRQPTPPSYHAIRLDHRRRAVWLPAGLGLDFGGFAKGWAAAQAANRLAAYAPALVDAGGDIAVSGPPTRWQHWPVAIANPFQPDHDCAIVALATGGIATSGRDYRRWQLHGTWQHHLLDPRTNQASHSDCVSATVIAPTIEQAEAAAKRVLILGSQAGLAWINQQPNYAALTVLENQQICYSQQFLNHVWSTP